MIASDHINAVEEDRVGVVVRQGFRGRKNGEFRIVGGVGVIVVVVVMTVVPIMVMVVTMTVIFLLRLCVEVWTKAVTRWRHLPVSVAERGRLSQQHTRQQDQGNNTTEHTFLFGTALSTSLTFPTVKSISTLQDRPNCPD